MDNDLDELANFLDDEDITLPKKLPKTSVNNKVLEKSEIHDGDTDSSDDEDNKYAADQKYTETGRDIKNVLKKHTTSSPDLYVKSPTWKSKPTASQNKHILTPIQSTPKDIYSDPFFGIRIVNPLISSQTMKERMAGKTPVTFSRLEKHLVVFDKSSDWVFAGVIVSKFLKTSQKGNQYACWTLSDLKDNLSTVSVFLFGKAYKDLWKTCTHVVVAILNPTPLENRKSSSDIAALSVLNPDQVMIWGQSKDLGICKARKKDGDPCTAFVNKNQCEFCIYHVKKEYKKYTGRTELQASSGGSLNDLRNKVLGKSEIFYAGKSYTAVQAKPNKKQKVKDKLRLSQLFSKCESRFGPESLTVKKSALLSSRVRLMKDAERLQKLTGSPATLTALALEGQGSSPKTLPTQKSTKPKFNGVVSSMKGEHEEKKHSIGLLNSSLNNTKIISKSKLGGVVETSQILKSNDKAVLNMTHQREVKVDSGLKQRKIEKNISSSIKKKPTKNRFENLIQLKSEGSKVTDMVSKNLKPEQNTQSQKSIATVVDVCFEFGEKETKDLLNEKTDLFHSNYKSKFEIHNSENVDELGVKSMLNNTNKHLQTPHSINLNRNISNKSKSPKPLSERKSPSEHNSKLNSNSDIEYCHVKKQSTDNMAQKANASPISPETAVKRVQDLVHINSPKLGMFSSLQVTVPTRTSKAKAKALKYVKLNGPIQREDTNIKKDKTAHLEKKRKQVENEENAKGESQSALSARFEELMNMTSRHEDLISAAENEAIDNYYEKMEKKEQMEEKMLTTYKIDCKAFRCLKCKYKWFSPSELCKIEKHPIKMISAVKRFFQCHNCKNRTVSLEIIPLHPCSNCGQSNWQRAPMMRERKSANVHLSIRGGEQKFMNSVETDTNLDLLVPDN